MVHVSADSHGGTNRKCKYPGEQPRDNTKRAHKLRYHEQDHRILGKMHLRGKDLHGLFVPGAAEQPEHLLCTVGKDHDAESEPQKYGPLAAIRAEKRLHHLSSSSCPFA